MLSAFTEVALLGLTLRKALITSIYSKVATWHLDVFRKLIQLFKKSAFLKVAPQRTTSVKSTDNVNISKYMTESMTDLCLFSAGNTCRPKELVKTLSLFATAIFFAVTSR